MEAEPSRQVERGVVTFGAMSGPGHGAMQLSECGDRGVGGV